jgi:hypothetical protein
MTQAIACTRNYDMFLDASGHIALVSGLAAVLQNCRSALSVKLGECFLNLTRGMPFDAAAFASYNPAQFEAAGRQLLLQIAGVVAVKSFTIFRKGAVFRYTAQISTIYGDGELNG